MNERLKLIREEQGMSQSEFAKKLGMGQSTLAMMEVGKRDILDRHIKTVCSIFNVSEEWLKTGQGAMYDNSTKAFVEELTRQMNLNPTLQGIIESYLNMGDEQRAFVDAFFKTLDETSKVNVNTAVDEAIKRTDRIFRAAKSDNNAPPQILDVSPDRIRKLEEADEADEADEI